MSILSFLYFGQGMLGLVACWGLLISANSAVRRHTPQAVRILLVRGQRDSNLAATTTHTRAVSPYAYSILFGILGLSGFTSLALLLLNIN